MLTPSQLSLFLRENSTRPRKSLGQNFLIDNNIKEKIIEHCEILKEDTVLEIGPGLGELTEGLCSKAKFVYAVEKDKLFARTLKENLKSFENLEIINQDILKFPLPVKHC
ncbi:MAG: hypothetical protein NTZ48_06865, partial [Candidatus Omnitrophica bacterium]|nr:hypothetical protein [Candidatus Omnitrophota bacterium]